MVSVHMGLVSYMRAIDHHDIKLIFAAGAVGRRSGIALQPRPGEPPPNQVLNLKPIVLLGF